MAFATWHALRAYASTLYVLPYSVDSRDILTPMQDLTLVMAQLDPLVGDIPGNAARAIEAVREARIEHGAEMAASPERFAPG